MSTLTGNRDVDRMVIFYLSPQDILSIVKISLFADILSHDLNYYYPGIDKFIDGETNLIKLCASLFSILEPFTNKVICGNHKISRQNYISLPGMCVKLIGNDIDKDLADVILHGDIIVLKYYYSTIRPKPWSYCVYPRSYSLIITKWTGNFQHMDKSIKRFTEEELIEWINRNVNDDHVFIVTNGHFLPRFFKKIKELLI